MQPTWYNRLFKQKFFNKLLLAYTLIILTTIVTLCATVIDNMIRTAEKDALNRTSQAVLLLLNYVESKENSVKLLVQQLYMNPTQYQDMMAFLDAPSSESGDYSSNDYDRENLIQHYLKAAAMQDNDILDTSIYQKSTHGLFTYSKDSQLDTEAFVRTNRDVFDRMDESFHGLLLTPSYLQKYGSYAEQRVYSISANIRGNILTSSFKRSIAILSVNFNPARISHFIDTHFPAEFRPELLILTKDGEVVFDSEEQYPDGTFPYFGQVRTSSLDRMLDVPSMVTTLQNDGLGFYAVGILPRSEISKQIRSSRNTVIALGAVSTIVAVLLGNLSIRYFSRRIRHINKAIAKVQSGDLKYRIPIDRLDDEISLIANNFNEMCDRVIDYINKVYLSELREKDAELYALQSQIDPHFLYNTLEVIRMETLAGNNEQAGRMIEILAHLFRGSVKGGIFIKLADEFAFSRNYLELYNIRYSDRLTVEFEVHSAILGYGIMKHLLQPIIENAVLHGMDHHRIDNLILVQGYVAEGDLYIRVADNGKGMDELQLNALRKKLAAKLKVHDRVHIGIVNVHQRIKLAFGEPYGIAIDSKQDAGTRITLRLPAMKAEELANHAQSVTGG